MNTGRPTPLHRQAEDVLMDFSIWEAKALKDGRIDSREATRAVGILRRLVKVTGKMAPTMAHVATCVSGQDGMFSDRAERGWKEAHSRRPTNIVQLFPETGDAA